MDEHNNTADINRPFHNRLLSAYMSRLFPRWLRCRLEVVSPFCFPRLDLSLHNGANSFSLCRVRRPRGCRWGSLPCAVACLDNPGSPSRIPLHFLPVPCGADFVRRPQICLIKGLQLSWAFVPGICTSGLLADTLRWHISISYIANSVLCVSESLRCCGHEGFLQRNTCHHETSSCACLFLFCSSRDKP